MKKILVDVREKQEFVEKHAEGAVSMPLSALMENTYDLSVFPKDAKIIAYCNTGRRSGIAKGTLESHGFTGVVNGINQEGVLSLEIS